MACGKGCLDVKVLCWIFITICVCIIGVSLCVGLHVCVCVCSVFLFYWGKGGKYAHEKNMLIFIIHLECFISVAMGSNGYDWAIRYDIFLSVYLIVQIINAHYLPITMI